MRYESSVILGLIHPLLAPSPGPTPTPTCHDAPELCHRIFEWTKQSWLAEGSYYFLVKPLRILLIVLLALIGRYLLHRLINRLVRSTTGDTGKRGFLRRRLPVALREAAGLVSERRRQRAEALGSVLRSVASAAVAVVAVMLVLGELGVDLAPLLASAGIAGIAIGFGAQNLVKDFLAGLFMLLEDQYGVGDVVDTGEVSGTVESVGLRITTIRDARGVVWYLRNGEISKVGNKSQGWALVVVDVPVGFAGVEEAAEVLRTAAQQLAEDPEWSEDLMEPPQVLGVEQITVDGAVLRTTAKTASDAQWRVGRELRRRLTEALESAGIAAQMSAGRVYIRPHAGPEPPGVTDTGQAGAT
jgi:small conductance mechanosensitive channel